jgi:putative transposase
LAIRIDQGPEFTSKALDQWAYQNGVQLKLIEAGKPRRRMHTLKALTAVFVTSA